MTAASDRTAVSGARPDGVARLRAETLRLAELLTDRGGRLGAGELRDAVHALAATSRGVYETLATATEHAAPRARNRLATIAVGVGEHGERLGRLAEALDAEGPQAPAHGQGQRSDDDSIRRQARLLAEPLTHQLHQIAQQGSNAVRVVPWLLDYPAAAHTATTALTDALAAQRAALGGSPERGRSVDGVLAALRPARQALHAAAATVAAPRPRTALTPLPGVFPRNTLHRTDPRSSSAGRGRR